MTMACRSSALRTARSDYKGIWYVSEAFMRYKTNDVLVHKDALPKPLRKKLNIK